MARTPSTDLEELLKLLRQIVVLAVGVYGLAREMPYTTLGLRLSALWAILYVSSGLIDIVYRRLSYRVAVASDDPTDSTKTSRSKLPSEHRAG